MTIRVRALSPEEVRQLTELAHARKRGAGLVRRAQIIMRAVEERLSAPQIAARMGLCGETVRFWIKRFNARGLNGLAEEMRSGRPPTSAAAERSRVLRTALTRPAELGLPFACWTLDRLVACLSEQGIGMRRSRISEILIDEGLQWRQEETWFGERIDPALHPAQKIDPIGGGAALVGCGQRRSRGRLEGAKHIAGDTPPAIIDLLGGPFALAGPHQVLAWIALARLWPHLV